MGPDSLSRRRLLGTIGIVPLSGCTALPGDDTGGWLYEMEEKEVTVEDHTCGTADDTASVEFGSSSAPSVSVRGKISTGSRCDRFSASFFGPSENADEEAVIIKVATYPPSEDCEGCEATFRYTATFTLDRQPMGVDVFHHPHNGPSEQVAVERTSEEVPKVR